LPKTLKRRTLYVVREDEIDEQQAISVRAVAAAPFT